MEDKDLRIDKYLWAIRLYKTRTQAAEACRAGKVRLSGQPVKASREVRVDDLFEISSGPIRKTIRVTALLHNRVNAKLAVNYYQDLTPAEELEKLRLIRDMKQGIRPRGLGRPTKKERRDLENFEPHS